MNSLRARLTLSYAIVVAVVLGLLSLLACRIAFELVARPTLDALALSVARAESAAVARPGVGTRETIARALKAASAPGIIAFAPRFGPPPRSANDLQRLNRGAPGAPGSFSGGPPGGGPPGNDPPGSDRFGGDRTGGASGSAGAGNTPFPDGGPFGTRDGDRSSWPFARVVVARFLGLDVHVIKIRGQPLAIAPDYARLNPLVAQFTAVLLGSAVLSVLLAWAIAAWLARQAVAPLIALTRELERFSAGDFAPRLVTTSEGSELGALVAAYNGAAAQVTRAFEERLDVERHMRRFIADAGHELRTPLTVIGGYLEILRKGGFDDSVTRNRAITALSAEARRMRSLIDRLLALARLERPDASQVVLVDVTAVAADAIAHVQAARGGDVTLVGSERAVVSVDPAELAEAIENVVDNAVKYGRGSAVLVRIDVAGGQAVIRVSDGGGSIAPAEQGRLFERFFRGDERGDIEGTGLGLAIAERAIARCGGRIKLEDGTSGHTTFAMSVPTAITRADASEPLRL